MIGPLVKEAASKKVVMIKLLIKSLIIMYFLKSFFHSYYLYHKNDNKNISFHSKTFYLHKRTYDVTFHRHRMYFSSIFCKEKHQIRGTFNTFIENQNL